MLQSLSPTASRRLRRLGVAFVTIEAIVLIGLGSWYLLAVPSSDAIDAATGLPAGGYSGALGVGALVLGVLLAGGAVLVARGRTWPVGLMVAWQPFQAVVGVSLLGEPALTAAIAAVAIVLLSCAVLALLSFVALLAGAGRRPE